MKLLNFFHFISPLPFLQPKHFWKFQIEAIKSVKLPVSILNSILVFIVKQHQNFFSVLEVAQDMFEYPLIFVKIL
jgi:hypothetical protein